MEWRQRKPIIRYTSKDTIIEQLAKIRGIQDIEGFLNPSANVLHDPYLLMNIEDAASRIIRAVYNGEKIAISVDVDADGILSSVALFKYLNQFTSNLYLTYHQRGEGHGIENQVDQISEDTNLLIICDSSSSKESVGPCEKLSGKGIDIIVLDHHEVEAKNPFVIMVNPKQEGDQYPNKEISGCGVVYKIMEVLDDTYLQSGTVNNFIDLIGIGMHADQMSCMVPENRYIMIQAMKNIQNEGLKALLKHQNIELEKVDSSTVAFKITPQINGVSRMEKIEMALDLLLEDDPLECLLLADKIVQENEERKQLMEKLFQLYDETVDPDDKIIIAIGDFGSKSFNGLIANKLAEKYQRPAIVMREYNGSLAGSFRSYAGFPLRIFLGQIKVVKYALGHEYAGGIGLQSKHLDTFKRVVSDLLKDTKFESVIEYDLEFDVDDINTELIQEIAEFNYLTGKDCPTAKVKITGIFVEERKTMGKSNNHVKIVADDFHLVKFHTDTDYGSELSFFDMIEAVGTLTINEWKGWNKKINIDHQLLIDDYRKV